MSNGAIVFLLLGCQAHTKIDFSFEVAIATFKKHILPETGSA